MAKSKNGRDDEHLKGENRLLKKQLKLAKKEIGQLRKRLAKYENIVDNYVTEPEEDNEFIETQIDFNCTECNKGTKVTTDLGARKLITCTVCSYREVIK